MGQCCKHYPMDVNYALTLSLINLKYKPKISTTNI